MFWNNSLLSSFAWSGEISNREAKEEIAMKIAQKVKDGDVIGVGSGSTAYLALFAIAERVKRENITITCIPTSHEISLTCTQLGLSVTSLFSHRPDWYFDGADEVDEGHNLIKWRWGALYQEKLIMSSSPKNYILIDQSKYVKTLGEKFPIPVEIFPESIHIVEERLRNLGAHEIILRMAKGKDGPIITERGWCILDVRFYQILLTFEKDIKSITGVIESGLFQGYELEIITV